MGEVPPFSFTASSHPAGATSDISDLLPIVLFNVRTAKNIRNVSIY